MSSEGPRKRPPSTTPQGWVRQQQLAPGSGRAAVQAPAAPDVPAAAWKNCRALAARRGQAGATAAHTAHLSRPALCGSSGAEAGAGARAGQSSTERSAPAGAARPAAGAAGVQAACSARPSGLRPHQAGASQQLRKGKGVRRRQRARSTRTSAAGHCSGVKPWPNGCPCCAMSATGCSSGSCAWATGQGSWQPVSTGGSPGQAQRPSGPAGQERSAMPPGGGGHRGRSAVLCMPLVRGGRQQASMHPRHALPSRHTGRQGSARLATEVGQADEKVSGTPAAQRLAVCVPAGSTFKAAARLIG